MVRRLDPDTHQLVQIPLTVPTTIKIPKSSKPFLGISFQEVFLQEMEPSQRALLAITQKLFFESRPAQVNFIVNPLPALTMNLTWQGHWKCNGWLHCPTEFHLDHWLSSWHGKYQDPGILIGVFAGFIRNNTGYGYTFGRDYGEIRANFIDATMDGSLFLEV